MDAWETGERCGSSPRALHRPLIALGIVAMVLLGGAACVRQTSDTEPRPAPDLVFVIPRGTAAAQRQGEETAPLPSRLSLVVGQSVVIRNEDEAMHYFFDAPIAPGQTLRRTFSKAGTYGYRGGLSCSLTEQRTLTVEVRAG